MNIIKKISNLQNPHSRAEKIGAVGLAVRLLWLRLTCVLSRRRLVLVVLTEHFGDIIACEPVARYLKQTDPDCLLVWICRQPFNGLLENNPNVDCIINVPCMNSWVRVQPLKLGHRQIDLHIEGRACPICRRCSIHDRSAPRITVDNYFEFGGLLKSFSLSAGLPGLDETPTLYFSPDQTDKTQTWNLPQKFLVFHCKSNESSRDWPDQKWQELLQLVHEKYGLPVVEVGLTSVLSGNPKAVEVINLCGKISFLETALVIQRADLFVGIESGPAHLANAVNCPGVILLGHYRGFENYVPYSGFYNTGGAVFVREKKLMDLKVLNVLAAIDQQIAVRTELSHAD